MLLCAKRFTENDTGMVPQVSEFRQKRVLLVMPDKLSQVHVRLLRGIRAYAIASKHWRTLGLWYGDIDVTSVQQGRGIDGVLWADDVSQVPSDLRPERLPVPKVDLSRSPDPKPWPNVVPDDEAVGRMAAEYFMSRGFRNFGYCGQTGRLYSQLRCDGFGQALAAAGHGCDVTPVSWEWHNGRFTDTAAEIEWLKSRPWPLAILAANAAPMPAWKAVLGLLLFSASLLAYASLRARRLEIRYEE